MQKQEGRSLGQRCLCSQRLVSLNYKDFSVAFIGLLATFCILSIECMCTQARRGRARFTRLRARRGPPSPRIFLAFPRISLLRANVIAQRQKTQREGRVVCNLVRRCNP